MDVFNNRDRVHVGGELLDWKQELLLELTPHSCRVGGGCEAVQGTNVVRHPLPPPPSPWSCPSMTLSWAGHPSRMPGLPLRSGNDAGRVSQRHLYVMPSPLTNCHLLKWALLFLLSVSSLPLILYAITLPAMQRLVYGGGPTLLHEVLEMIWEKEYSLASLVRTTGNAGGRNRFLMLTFGLFAVLGPALQSICLLLHVLLGLHEALLGDCIEWPHCCTMLHLALYRGTWPSVGPCCLSLMRVGPFAVGRYSLLPCS
jgi:hypothetical protein